MWLISKEQSIQQVTRVMSVYNSGWSALWCLFVFMARQETKICSSGTIMRNSITCRSPFVFCRLYLFKSAVSFIMLLSNGDIKADLIFLHFMLHLVKSCAALTTWNQLATRMLESIICMRNVILPHPDASLCSVLSLTCFSCSTSIPDI